MSNEETKTTFEEMLRDVLGDKTDAVIKPFLDWRDQKIEAECSTKGN